MAISIRREKVSSAKKRISVSQKRQITIPLEFYNVLGIENEVDCSIHNDAIVIRPVYHDNGEFDEQILADLLQQGYEGEGLLAEFKKLRKLVRPAVRKLLSEAEVAAESPGRYLTYDDVFDAEKN